MNGAKYISIFALFIFLSAASSIQAKSNYFSNTYTINQYGVTQWQLDSDGNTQSYSSLSNWMVSGENNAFEDYNQSLNSSETKSFLGNEFKSTELSGKYKAKKTGNETETESTSKTTTKLNVLGIKGKETEWNYTSEWEKNQDKGKPSEKVDNPKETYYRDVTDGKVYDGKGQAINDKQTKDYSVKQESVSSQNFTGKTAKALKDNTTVTLYETEYGKYNKGVFGYINETGELDGKFQALGIESGGSAKLNVSKDGIGLNQKYKADLIVAKYGDSTEFQLGSQTEVQANYEVYAKAFAKEEFDARVGKEGVKIKTEAGAGVIAGGEASGGLALFGGVIKFNGSAQGGYGAQLKGHIDGELSTSKIKFSTGGGVALGLGGGLDGGIEVDLQQLSENLAEPAVTYIEAISSIQSTYNAQRRAIQLMVKNGATPEEIEKRLALFEQNRLSMINQLDQISGELPWWLPSRSIVLDAANNVRDGLLADNKKKDNPKFYIDWEKLFGHPMVPFSSPGTPLPDSGGRPGISDPGVLLHPTPTPTPRIDPYPEYKNPYPEYKNPYPEYKNPYSDS